MMGRHEYGYCLWHSLQWFKIWCYSWICKQIKYDDLTTKSIITLKLIWMYLEIIYFHHDLFMVWIIEKGAQCTRYRVLKKNSKPNLLCFQHTDMNYMVKLDKQSPQLKIC
jgi:hypothetical protein